MVIGCNSDPTTTGAVDTSDSNLVKSGFSVIKPDASGLDFNNKLKDDPLSDKNVLSYRHYFNGAGVGIGDFNKDGLPDIFFAGNEVPNEIYLNEGDFKFKKLGPEAGINVNKVWSSGVSIIDINMDGYDDIYVSQQGPYAENQRKNLFYINNGDLTFTESAALMGLDDPNYSTQAVFLDYDKDGDLDCYVLNESKYAGVVLKTVYDDLKIGDNMRKASGSLFENKGSLQFQDVTEKAGVMNYGYGLGVAVSDLNGDNWPDIYVANDYTVPDFMYINQKDGTFKESVKDFTKQTSYFGMGCDVADINNDGLVDIGVVDMAAEDHFRDKTLMAGMDTDLFKYYFWNLEYQLQYMFNSLQLNNGNNTFSNIAALAGVLKSDWSWAALFSDFNLDGHKDYFVSNGFRRYSRDNDFMNKMKEIRAKNNNTIPLSKRNEVYAMMPEVKLKNKLYVNDGNLHFDDDSPAFSHPNLETYSYGAAIADFDNDGDMDMIVSNIDQPALLLKNKSREDSGRNFVKIHLDEKNPSKKLGSKITVVTNDKSQFQEYNFVRGYESCMEEILLFGLDKEPAIKEIKIVWPDGNVQVISNPEINTTHNIQYAKGSSFQIQQENKNTFLSEMSPTELGVDFVHMENFFDDFETEILLPQKQTYFGPAISKGDMNGDGLDDVYFGGAKDQASVLYLQNQDGTFTKESSQPWRLDNGAEDVGAIIVDPNQDGLQDLIVISGGSGDFVGEKHKLLNRFYANMGQQYGRIANVIPEDLTASYAIIGQNIDDDPQQEILILGGAQPGKYPVAEKTVLLDYQNNKYVDVVDQLIPELNKDDGLIRSAIWTDLNGDAVLELVTVGEWQNLQVYTRKSDGTYAKDASWSSSNKQGWWRSVKAADLDGDGDQDLIIGNVGKNFKQKASQAHPLYLYSNDFDGNGTRDCVLAKEYNNKIVPARGKECSTEQMPFISENFPTYKEFAAASITDILGKDKIDEGIKLKAVDFHSYILWNEGNKFSYQKLPHLAQAFPINDIEVHDFNKDGQLDIIVLGNDYNTEYETPRLDAGYGLVLLNDKNKFSPISIRESGLYNPGDAKKLVKINRAGKECFFIANNNDKPALYQVN